MSQDLKQHRSAESGEFVTGGYAREHPATTVAETVKIFTIDEKVEDFKQFCREHGVDLILALQNPGKEQPTVAGVGDGFKLLQLLDDARLVLAKQFTLAADNQASEPE